MKINAPYFKEKMRKDGYFKLPFIAEVAELRTQVIEVSKQLDAQGKVRHWRQEDAGDERTFFHPICLKASNELFENIDELCSIYMEEESCVAVNMFNIVTAANGHLGSGGGWHRDSFARQIKTFIYLNDVDETNGPFCYVKGSHHLVDKIRYFSKADKNKKTRYTDSKHHETFIKQAYQLTGVSGSILIADTSGRHSGLPVKKGKRLALTQYRYPKSSVEKMRKRFLSL